MSRFIQILICDPSVQQPEPFICLFNALLIHVFEEKVQLSVDHDVVHLLLVESGYTLDSIHEPLVLMCESLLAQVDGGHDGSLKI